MIYFSIKKIESILLNAGLDAEAIKNTDLELVSLWIDTVCGIGLNKLNSSIPTEPEIKTHLNKIQHTIETLNALLSENEYAIKQIDVSAKYFEMNPCIYKDYNHIDTAQFLEMNDSFLVAVERAKNSPFAFFTGGSFVHAKSRTADKKTSSFVKWLAINMRPVWENTLHQEVTRSVTAPYTLFLFKILEILEINTTKEAIRDHVKRTKNHQPELISVAMIKE